MGVEDAGTADPRGRLVGGIGAPVAVGVELVPVGDVVHRVDVSMAGSVTAVARPEPRSLNRERNFLSRAWISSMPGILPWGSASHSPQWA